MGNFLQGHCNALTPHSGALGRRRLVHQLEGMLALVIADFANFVQQTTLALPSTLDIAPAQLG